MSILLCSLWAVAFIWLTGAFGLLLGVLRPNFQWTSEAMPIKQSMNMMLSILFGFTLPILAAVGCWLSRSLFSTDWYLGLTMALLALLSLGTTLWLNTRGAARFDQL